METHPTENTTNQPSPDVTSLLLEWSGGNKEALDQLAPVIYGELVRIARSRLKRERDSLTLQPTVLVHEAYLRLADSNRLRWQDRNHFFAVAASVMRRVLIDHSRKRDAQKRGNRLRVDYRDDLEPVAQQPSMLALDEALQTLAAVDERKSRVIELKFFGGLTAEEIADVLEISVATVGRDLRMGQAWLHRELSRS